MPTVISTAKRLRITFSADCAFCDKAPTSAHCGPDELPIEAVHDILDYKPECIVEAFNNILRTNKMPNDWRKIRMVPLFKGKGHVLECNNYRGITLMSHTMKLWERMIEARLREITKIADNQYGFRPGKSTTEPIFALRMLQEEIQREKQRAPHGFRRP